MHMTHSITYVKEPQHYIPVFECCHYVAVASQICTESGISGPVSPQAMGEDQDRELALVP